MTNMKICIIHNLWGKEARGGAESILESIVSHLQLNKHQVFVITTQAESKKIIIETIDSVKVYALPSDYVSLAKLPQWRRLLFHIVHSFNVITYIRVKKIIKSENPEVAWTHNLVGLGSIIFCLFHSKNIRHIHTLHDIQLLHPSGLLMRGQEKLINSFIALVYQLIQKVYISNFSEIISPSQWLLKTHRQKGFFKENKCYVLPNPFLRQSNIGGEKHKDSKDSFTFLYVGQIESHKGIAILIDSFKRIINQQLRLVIVGEGSLLQNIKDQNVDTRIEYMGRQNKASVREIMLAVDCLVVPSICYENYPTVILEAIAAQTPVLGSNFGGITELIPDNQFLFEPTENEIVKKLIWAFEHHNELENLFFTSAKRSNIISLTEYCQQLKF